MTQSSAEGPEEVQRRFHGFGSPRGVIGQVPSTTLPKKYRNWVFKVDEQEMRRLADECRKALTPEGGIPESIGIRLAVRLFDGASQEHLSLDDFLAIENERRRAIIGAELTAETRTASIVCRFAMEPRRESSLTVVGQDRQWVYTTVSRIEDRLRNMTEWYPRGDAWLAGAIFTAFVSIFAVYLLQVRGVVLETIERGDSIVLNTAGKVTLLSVLCAMCVGAIGARVLLPNIVFRIGYGIQRADARDRLRSQLGWTVGVGTIVALVVSAVERLLWSPP